MRHGQLVLIFAAFLDHSLERWAVTVLLSVIFIICILKARPFVTLWSYIWTFTIFLLSVILVYKIRLSDIWLLSTRLFAILICEILMCAVLIYTICILLMIFLDELYFLPRSIALQITLFVTLPISLRLVWFSLLLLIDIDLATILMDRIYRHQ